MLLWPLYPGAIREFPNGSIKGKHMSFKTRLEQVERRATYSRCPACASGRILQIRYEGEDVKESGPQYCQEGGRVLPVTRILVRYESDMEARQ